MADNDRPRITGLQKHVEDGYALWLPIDWFRFEMSQGHHGVIFSPHADDLNTCFSAEKRRLKYKVKRADVAALSEGFMTGLKSLPALEIESQDEVIEGKIIAFGAQLMFQEGQERRKRWIRVLYAAETQLVLLAQGRTIEDFEYWLPVFYNTMMTMEIL
jgi:hypothetical protein